MDEFGQEFEFKPITEGLGFQRKARTIKEEIDNGGLAREEHGRQIPQSSLSNLEKEREKTFNELMASLPKKTEFIPDQKIKENIYAEIRFRPVSVSFPAMVFDGIVSFALTLLFLIALILVTKIDLPHLVQSTSLYVSNQVGMAVLFIAVSQMYLVASRAFAGQTLGEWAFDVQLGTKEDQEQIAFPLMVMARSIIITVTGIFVLPIISILFGTDYAGKLSGLRLYRAE